MFAGKSLPAPTDTQEAPVSGIAISASRKPRHQLRDRRPADLPSGPGTVPGSPETDAGRWGGERVYGRARRPTSGVWKASKPTGCPLALTSLRRLPEPPWESGEATRSTPPGSGDEHAPLGTPEDYYSVAAALFGGRAGERE